MRRLQTNCVFLLFLMIGTHSAVADVLRMPEPGSGAGEQTVLSVEMPARGMTMAKVEELFGEPVEKVPAVGDPPISRWVYNDFIVYFEHQWVLESVLTRGAPQP